LRKKKGAFSPDNGWQGDGQSLEKIGLRNQFPGVERKKGKGIWGRCPRDLGKVKTDQGSKQQVVWAGFCPVNRRNGLEGKSAEKSHAQ